MRADSVTNAASATRSGSGRHRHRPGERRNCGLTPALVDSPTSVLFGGSGNNLLVLDPGFSMSGSVVGSDSASNTLELASAAAACVIAGLGTNFTGFGAIVFDPGATWSISGDTVGLSGVISGFTPSDTIELTGVSETGSAYNGGILTLDTSGAPATLDLPGDFGLANFHVSTAAGNTEVTALPCFAAGTRIACPDGERAVESLAPGELVCLAGEGHAAITWVGHRRVECARHSRPADVWPVRVRMGAFGAGMPHRDLLLSPDHAVFVEGDLIPVRYLINGSTIVQERVASVTYYHVELAAHAVILADGLPCESYLDTGNRDAFADAGGYRDARAA